MDFGAFGSANTQPILCVADRALLGHAQ
jgi:hypothetical protein